MDKKVFTKEKIMEQNIVHKKDVSNLMLKVVEELKYRSRNHDLDKDIPENAEILANALNTKQWEKWNKNHLEEQRHHSEWIHNHIYKDGVNLFDLLDMVVDGCVANYRRTGIKGEYESQDNYFERKGFDPFTSIILANTFMICQEWFGKILENEKIPKVEKIKKYEDNWKDCTPYD